ncbi:MAG: class I SAM-dependent methyltransferase [Phycisphaerales bacterium]
MTSWHETDAFWSEFGPQMFHAKRWERTPGEVDGVLAMLGLGAGARVLDMPCGPGRHSLELARRGFRVTGVDRTRAYLEEARRRADAERLEIEWVHEDMRTFERPGTYNAVLNLYTSFGYFRDSSENLRALQAMHRALRPGGRLLMEVMGKEVLARTFKERIWEPQPDGSIYLAETRVLDNWSWVESRWMVVRGGEIRETLVSHYVYSAVELIGWLERAGFSGCRALGSLAGVPYDHAAERLVVVGEA